MPLHVIVGRLRNHLSHGEETAADRLRHELGAINRLLVAHDLPLHHEPEDGDWAIVDHEMYGYSGLHYLRRVAAHLADSGELPEPGDDIAAEDPILSARYAGIVRDPDDRPRRAGRFARPRYTDLGPRPFPQLIDHSDAEGYYVPVAFREPLVGDIAGELLGSSQALIRELELLTEALEIPALLTPDTAALRRAAEQQGSGQRTWERFGIESFTCVRLLDAARRSVRHKALLVFDAS